MSSVRLEPISVELPFNQGVALCFCVVMACGKKIRTVIYFPQELIQTYHELFTLAKTNSITPQPDPTKTLVLNFIDGQNCLGKKKFISGFTDTFYTDMSSVLQRNKFTLHANKVVPYNTYNVLLCNQLLDHLKTILTSIAPHEMRILNLTRGFLSRFLFIRHTEITTPDFATFLTTFLTLLNVYAHQNHVYIYYNLFDVEDIQSFTLHVMNKKKRLNTKVEHKDLVSTSFKTQEALVTLMSQNIKTIQQIYTAWFHSQTDPVMIQVITHTLNLWTDYDNVQFVRLIL
jgi:hypothetical protein